MLLAYALALETTFDIHFGQIPGSSDFSEGDLDLGSGKFLMKTERIDGCRRRQFLERATFRQMPLPF
jgi:hypothetical protein